MATLHGEQDRDHDFQKYCIWKQIYPAVDFKRTATMLLLINTNKERSVTASYLGLKLILNQSECFACFKVTMQLKKAG